MHLHPWFEPFSSSNVSIRWGARTHTLRKGGPAVNSGPPLRFRRMAKDTFGAVGYAIFVMTSRKRWPAAKPSAA